MEDERLMEALTDLREAEARRTVQAHLTASEDPPAILKRCRLGVEAVETHFEAAEYFLPNLIKASENLLEISARVKPHIDQVHGIQRVGTVVIGTVLGAIHDIGKDIVTFRLDATGFTVHDVSIDVLASTFAAKIREVAPDIVGLSGFLTLAYDAMKQTVNATAASGLRNQVKIIHGSGHIDAPARQYTGADTYAMSASDGVAICRTWIGAAS